MAEIKARRAGPWSMRKTTRDTWLNRKLGHPVNRGFIRYPPLWHFIIFIPFSLISARLLIKVWNDPRAIFDSATAVGLIIYFMPCLGLAIGMAYTLSVNILRRGNPPESR